MLALSISGGEYYDPETAEFITVKPQIIQLEHSLVSISKWESRWEKPFLGNEQKSNEELLDYIRCMTITQNVNPKLYLTLSEDNIKAVNDYINSKMSATFFSDEKREGAARARREIITSELIYYWMIAQNIPMECQKWHINRLLTLIRICSIKNSPDKKMKPGEIMRRNTSLNAARRAALHSRG